MKPTKESKGLTRGVAGGMAADAAIARKIAKGAKPAQLPVATDKRPCRDFNAKVIGHGKGGRSHG